MVLYVFNHCITSVHGLFLQHLLHSTDSFHTPIAVSYIPYCLAPQDWSSTVLQDFSLVLLLLLRKRFLTADDHMTMREIFLEEPSKLLLADIQKAYLLLHDEEDYRKISSYNRLLPDPPG